MIRFVVAPDGTVVPDLAENLPGRGLWLTAERAIVTTACRKGLFAKAAKRAVTAPETLPDRVESLLVRRCVELLSLARRAGLVAAGHRAVEEAVAGGRSRLLLIASDSTGRDAAELAQKAPGGTTTGRQLSSAELGQALGRDMMVFAALSDSGLTERLMRDLARLGGFRPAPGAREGTSTVDEAPARKARRTNG
jgi:predicted RNA-binding protein YlxR (DUF448 family)